MYINVNGTIKSLYYGDYAPGSGYGPDCAADLLNAGATVKDEDGNPAMTPEEYRSAVEYLRDAAAEEKAAREEYGLDTIAHYPVVEWDE
ncbi:MAG: hypothetical protein ACLU8W_09920 [Clostridia bacterium]